MTQSLSKGAARRLAAAARTRAALAELNAAAASVNACTWLLCDIKNRKQQEARFNERARKKNKNVTGTGRMTTGTIPLRHTDWAAITADAKNSLHMAREIYKHARGDVAALERALRQ